MQVHAIISLERGDTAEPRQIEDAYGLGGGQELPEAVQRAFGRVRGNAFSLEDVLGIRDALRVAQHAPVPLAFLDARLQAVFADGIQVNRQLAVRQAESFLACLLKGLPWHSLAEPAKTPTTNRR